jgi:hypothetical protein
MRMRIALVCVLASCVALAMSSVAAARVTEHRMAADIAAYNKAEMAATKATVVKQIPNSAKDFKSCIGPLRTYLNAQAYDSRMHVKGHPDAYTYAVDLSNVMRWDMSLTGEKWLTGPGLRLWKQESAYNRYPLRDAHLAYTKVISPVMSLNICSWLNLTTAQQKTYADEAATYFDLIPTFSFNQMGGGPSLTTIFSHFTGSTKSAAPLAREFNRAVTHAQPLAIKTYTSHVKAWEKKEGFNKQAIFFLND